MIFVFLIVVEHVFKLKILEDWNDDLNNKNSDAFKDLASRLEKEVRLVQTNFNQHYILRTFYYYCSNPSVSFFNNTFEPEQFSLKSQVWFRTFLEFTNLNLQIWKKLSTRGDLIGVKVTSFKYVCIE